MAVDECKFYGHLQCLVLAWFRSNQYPSTVSYIQGNSSRKTIPRDVAHRHSHRVAAHVLAFLLLRRLCQGLFHHNRMNCAVLSRSTVSFGGIRIEKRALRRREISLGRCALVSLSLDSLVDPSIQICGVFHFLGSGTALVSALRQFAGMKVARGSRTVLCPKTYFQLLVDVKSVYNLFFFDASCAIG